MIARESEFGPDYETRIRYASRVDATLPEDVPDTMVPRAGTGGLYQVLAITVFGLSVVANVAIIKDIAGDKSIQGATGYGLGIISGLLILIAVIAVIIAVRLDGKGEDF